MNQKNKPPRTINDFILIRSPSKLSQTKNSKKKMPDGEKLVKKETQKPKQVIQQKSIKHNKSLSSIAKHSKALELKLRNPSLMGVSFKERSKSRANVASYKNINEIESTDSPNKLVHRIKKIEKKEMKQSGLRSMIINQTGHSKNTDSHLSVLAQNSKKSVPEQILQYIKKREDVEIIQYFQQYKKQFYTKSKLLHQYIYNSEEPEKVKNTYLNEGDSHFLNGLEGIMLKLFRNGTIVPQSYTNLRQEAVQEIEKWVIGWIHRKINYGRLMDEEENQVNSVENVLGEMAKWRNELYDEDTSF